MASGKNEVSERNEEKVIGNWRKGNPSLKVAKNLTELYSTALWKVQLVNDETRYKQGTSLSKILKVLRQDSKKLRKLMDK